MKITENSVIVHSKEQVSSDILEDKAILGLKKSVYYGLEEVGARVWELIEKPMSVKQIIEEILKEYKVEREECEKDILVFLEKLDREGLIESKNE